MLFFNSRHSLHRQRVTYMSETRFPPGSQSQWQRVAYVPETRFPPGSRSHSVDTAEMIFPGVYMQVILFHTLSANCHERVFYGDFKFPLFLTMIEFFSNACIAGTTTPSASHYLHSHHACTSRHHPHCQRQPR